MQTSHCLPRLAKFRQRQNPGVCPASGQLLKKYSALLASMGNPWMHGKTCFLEPSTFDQHLLPYYLESNHLRVRNDSALCRSATRCLSAVSDFHGCHLLSFRSRVN